ncbi:CxxH/CxxC protein [Thermoflavimicrobium daqui]|uniref:CxxH/CxxC protein n=1 Tax=Thermoflavimicrobium daqui TaxID=2137476 RepID=A0A364K3H9_9BACL|nr:CxxH/CxxC protein [Thermoflavimicrobium daqui]RAL23383.1 CxxH/CxxC protein [Thermoflavimicrobium daqui]
MIWYACEEHLDYIMDDIIDTYMVAPILESYQPIRPSEKKACKWCGQSSEYQLTFELESS